MRKSLRVRLTVLFIALAVGPLLLVGSFLIQRSFSYERQRALEFQHQIADSSASEVSGFFKEVVNDLTARGGDLQNFEGEDHAQELSLFLTALSSGPYRDVYQELTLLDENGNEHLRVSRNETIPDSALVSRADTPEFQEAAASGDTYFGPVRFAEGTGEPFMTIAIPLYDLRSVQLRGVLIADIRLAPAANLLAAADVGPNQSLYVLDSKNRLVIHQDRSMNRPLGEHVSEALREPGVVEGLNGDRVVTGIEPIRLGDAEYLLVVEQPLNVALGAANDTLTAIVIIGLVALVVATGLSLLVVRQVVTPIESLSETAQIISGGQLERQVAITTEDEIGTLGNSFNAMTRQLRDTLLTEQAARREAQEASRAKDLFLATMSHELRTPLNAIIGFLSLMIVSGQMDDDNVYMAERSMANSDRLLSLINNILDLSRISAGSLEIIPVEMSPVHLANGLKNDMALQFKEKKLAFRVQVDSRLPETIFHDEERLYQIAANLVGNALKFTDMGEIMLGFARGNDKLIITCQDTGIGIPKAKQQMIFDEFSQVDSSSTRSHGGAGLGLSIVKRLAVLMDGNVRVESTEGQGSRFTVELPMNLERTPRLSAPVTDQPILQSA